MSALPWCAARVAVHRVVWCVVLRKTDWAGKTICGEAMELDTWDERRKPTCPDCIRILHWRAKLRGTAAAIACFRREGR